MADYFTKLPRVPSPLEVMRKMGLNVPSEKGLANLFTVLPEVIGPQADIAGMVKDAKQIVPLIQSGSYGPALSSLGMATSAIPMMFLPGTVAGVKEGVKESVDSIKGAPLYEKLNPDKFKSGTPYAEKDWDKADGWRNYVDARKTAEKKITKRHINYTPLGENSLKNSLPSTQYLVKKIREKFPDAELGLELSSTQMGKSNYLTLSHPNKNDIQIRLSDHSTGLSRMSDYGEMLPHYVPEKGTSFKDPNSPNPPFGQIGRDSFDKRINRVLEYFKD